MDARLTFLGYNICMRFLCDEMLAGLARWLRAAGHDADMAEPGEADRTLLERARNQGRTLLTRDRAILQIKDAANVATILETQGLDAWAQELRERHGVDWLAHPFTRCLMCNVDLVDAGPETLARMPEDSRALPGPFRACPKCHRGYWPGSHVKRMRTRLERFAGHGHGETP